LDKNIKNNYVNPFYHTDEIMTLRYRSSRMGIHAARALQIRNTMAK